MPAWLVSVIEKVVYAILSEVLASHGVTPKTPPTP